MNFVFISPHFPENYWNFCDRLRANGVNVLGIGDAPYETLPALLKSALTEYYRVDSMADYDAMVRAMGYFTFKYGKIDWLESNNEYWLERDAMLRTAFEKGGGAAGSEYPPGYSGRTTGTFLARNRLIAAQREALCVAEARTRSGTLNTVGRAARQGRPVLAVPGSIYNA